MVSSVAGGANGANGLRGLLGPWVLGAADKMMNKWKLPLPAAGRWAAGEQSRKREDEAVRHRDCEEVEGIGYKGFSHLHPLFFLCFLYQYRTGIIRDSQSTSSELPLPTDAVCFSPPSYQSG